MPTTSNFGWTTPADTDLVKDGAAAIRTLGNGIDTSLVDLKGGTTGQILSKNSNTDLDYTWINNDQGDITEVQAGTGISVASGTGPVPVVTNTVATTFDAKGDLVVGTGADTFAKLTVGTNGHTLVADSSTSTGLKWQAASSSGMTLIANTTLGSAASSVTFSSISGSYQDLMILITGRTSSTDAALQIEFNTDTASNYYLNGSGRTGTAGESTNLYNNTAKGEIALPNSSTDAKYAGVCKIIIPKYAGTTLKKCALFETAGISGSNINSRLITISWDNTAAITEVKLLSSVGNFIAGSSFSLYGLG